MTKNEEPNPATGHTPGPWKVYGNGVNMDELSGNKGGSIFADDGSNDGDGRTICDIAASERVVHKDKRRHDEFVHSQVDEANARLIAAAPEMYEQLKALLEFADDIKEVYGLGSTWKNIRALVAKAEGGAS